MSRHHSIQRRNPNSASASESQDKMGDQRLQEFLAECSSTEEEAHLKSHGQTFANTQELQNATFRFLLRDRQRLESSDEDSSLEMLKKLCHFMLSLYRTTASGPKLTKNSFIPTSTANDMLRTRVVVLQYLPHFINLHLLTRCRNHRYHFLDAFLLSLYNIEASEQQALRAHMASVNTVPNNPLHRPLIVKVPSLATSSSYHDNARLEGEDKLDQRPSGLTFQFENLSFVENLNASSRPNVLRVLLQTFNRHIVDVSKFGLDQFVRATLKLLERGYNNSKLGQQRVFLDQPVQLELLYGAYVCMYNGFQVAANQIVDMIHERASLSGCPEVLLLSNSIKSLVLSSSPSQVSTSHVSTPQQMAKNFITNASFRAKKMHTDIPKVQVDAAIAEDGGSAHSSSTSGKPNLASMSSIVEEENKGLLVEEDKTPSKSEAGASSKVFNKDKLKDKLKLRKNKTSSSATAVLSSENEQAASMLNVDQQPSLKPKLSFEKKEKKESSKNDKKKRNEKFDPSELAPLVVQPPPTHVQPPQSEVINGENTATSAINSVEKVEELIQMKKLPSNETITIFSPESGTTIF